MGPPSRRLTPRAVESVCINTVLVVVLPKPMAYSDGAASSEIEAMSDYTVTPGSIVEIGPIPFVARAYPEATQFYSTWAGDNSPADRANGLDVVSLRGLPGIIRQLRDPALALIVVHSFPFAPWNPLLISRMVFRRNVL